MNRLIDFLRLLNPGGRKSIDSKQVMRHPHAWIWVGIELNALPFVREVIELAGLDRLPDLTLRDRFPLVQISVWHSAGDVLC